MAGERPTGNWRREQGDTLPQTTSSPFVPRFRGCRAGAIEAHVGNGRNRAWKLGELRILEGALAKPGWERSFPGAWDAFVRGGCKCVYCGFEGTTYSAWRQLISDHLIPENKGGENRRENLVVSCSRCNTFKRDYDPSEGHLTCPPSDEVRQELIRKATRVIESRERHQGYPEDFRLMMEEINALRTHKAT